MRYDSYEKKILKVARVERTIFNFRAPILLGLTIVMVCAGVLIGTKGIVSDSKKVLKQYHYGDQIKYDSKSFMSDVTYEFREITEENWEEEVPIIIGRYEMRSCGKNSFNKYYYGKAQPFEIIPKKIDVKVVESKVTYGDDFTLDLSEYLEFGDYLKDDYTFSIENKESDVWKITPNVNSLHIYSDTGEDVTKCYDFNVVSKSVNILRRALTVQSGSSEKQYDKIPLENDEFSIIEGELVPGDTISLSQGTAFAETGETENEHTYYIKDATGRDMTIHYNITTTSGTLTVYKIPLTLTSQDYETEYNGKNQKFDLDEVEVSGDILSDHELELSYTSGEAFKNVGQYDNGFEAKIVEDDTDVTCYYDITYRIGTTTITKRSLSIQANSSTKTYDATAIYNDSYTILEGSLADGHTIAVSNVKSNVNAGEYENDLVFNIIDEESNDATENYDLTSSSGTITINPVELEISGVNTTYTYDGYPHIISFDFDDSKLVGGDHVVFLHNEERKDVGTYSATDVQAYVKTSGNLDNSDNYDITMSNLDDVLTIKKRDLSLVVKGYTKTYDGKPITDEEFERYEIVSGTLADNEYLRVEYDENQKNAGTYDVAATIYIYHMINPFPDPVIDTLVTANYNLDIEYEQFTINKRVLEISAVNVEHEYDRDASFLETHLDEYIVYGGDGLVEGHSLDGITTTDVGINVGVYDFSLVLDDVIILDEDGEDVTENYDIVNICGAQLTITKRDVTVTMSGGHKMYDGVSYYVDDYSADRLLEGDHLTFEDLPEVTYVEDGHVPNVPSAGHVYMSNNEEVTSNYNLTFAPNPGEIYIDPRPIKIAITPYVKVFDNIAIHEHSELTIVEEDGFYPLVTGDTYEVISDRLFDIGYLHAGTYDNAVELRFYNSEHRDITQSYEVTFVPATIVITPRPIVMDIREQHIVYDGYAHDVTYTQNNVTNDSTDIYIHDGTLPDGFSLSAEVSIQNMVDAKRYNNYVKTTTIKFGGSTYAYPGDFSLTFVQNSQRIYTRDITLKTVGGSKIYDGQLYGVGLNPEDLYNIVEGSLADNHEIVNLAFTPIYQIGTYDFAITEFKIIDCVTNKDVTSNYNVRRLSSEVRIYEV